MSQRHPKPHLMLTPLADLEQTQPVVDFIGDADFALLGEASHGTHEFYAFRAAVTKRLILESGCRAVVVEADWPDAYRVNRYVRHASGDGSGRRRKCRRRIQPECERRTRHEATRDCA